LIASVVFLCSGAPRLLPSFPTRRSSDLKLLCSRRSHPANRLAYPHGGGRNQPLPGRSRRRQRGRHDGISIHEIAYKVGSGHVIRDRKSTRLNSSHVKISYAVFCLKKKTT